MGQKLRQTAQTRVLTAIWDRAAATMTRVGGTSDGVQSGLAVSLDHSGLPCFGLHISQPLSRDPQFTLTIQSNDSHTVFSSQAPGEHAVCLADGCFTLATNDILYPFFSSWTFANISGGTPSRRTFRVLEDEISEGCGVSDSPSLAPAKSKEPVPIIMPGPMYQKKNRTTGTLECYRWWRGSEPVLPSTPSDDCNPLALTFAGVDKCVTGETHCWYVEVVLPNRANPKCNDFNGVGGCWSTLTTVEWPKTNAARQNNPAPLRGTLTNSECEQVANASLNAKILASTCIACEGSFCTRTVKEGSSGNNFWNVSSRALQVADVATDDRNDCQSNPEAARLKHKDGICDEIYNTLDCDFDGGDCCITSQTETPCTIPWKVRPPWRIALVAGGQAFATMPHSFHRALRSQKKVYVAAEGSDTWQATDSHIPTLACPECASYVANAAFRAIPFHIQNTNTNNTGPLNGTHAAGSMFKDIPKSFTKFRK